MKRKVTTLFNLYFVRFIARLIIFLFVFYMWCFHHQEFYDFIFTPFVWKVSIFHILWGLFMLIMFWHIIPSERITMGARKAKKETFIPVENYDELELMRYVKDQNIKAWTILLIWVSLIAVIAVLYLTGVMREIDVWMIVVFFYLCDTICIMLFCPFQRGIMKNRCCVNCRIFDWGHFMMFSPLVVIRGFYTWSLFFTSILVLIMWELRYAKHPERFWSGSNKTIRCENCKDKLCKIKKPYIPK